MFSPYPDANDGWFVMPATLVDGSEIDVLTEQPVTWDKPPLGTATLTLRRYRIYIDGLHYTGNEALSFAYARYLCRDWNSRHPRERHLRTVAVVYMQEDMYKPEAEPRKVVMAEHTCNPRLD